MILSTIQGEIIVNDFFSGGFIQCIQRAGRESHQFCEVKAAKEHNQGFKTNRRPVTEAKHSKALCCQFCLSFNGKDYIQDHRERMVTMIGVFIQF